MAGARVAPGSVRVAGGVRPTSTFPPPDSLADLLAATADAAGEGQIKGCRAEDVEAVWVEAAGFGRQASDLSAVAGNARVITLKPAGRLTGRVQADDPSAARGLEVIAMTQPQAAAGPQMSGEGRTTTDADGRFEMPALAAGKLALNVIPAEGSKLRPKLPTELPIEPGKTTEVTIALEGPPRERTVAGRVVDREGQPVASATVFQSGDSQVRTETKTGRGRAIPAERCQRAADLPVRPQARLPPSVGLASTPESTDVSLVIHRVDQPPSGQKAQTPPPPCPARKKRCCVAPGGLTRACRRRVLKKGGEPRKCARLKHSRALSRSACSS